MSMKWKQNRESNLSSTHPAYRHADMLTWQPRQPTGRPHKAGALRRERRACFPGLTTQHKTSLSTIQNMTKQRNQHTRKWERREDAARTGQRVQLSPANLTVVLSVCFHPHFNAPDDVVDTPEGCCDGAPLSEQLGHRRVVLLRVHLLGRLK